MQFKGLGAPNKYFATQNKQMYIRLHLLAGTAYRKTPVSIFTSNECMKKKKHISEEQHYLCEIGLEKMPYGSSWLYKSYTEESLTHITITAAPCKVPALP